MRKAIICFLEKGDEFLLLDVQYKDKRVWSGVSGYIDEGETAKGAVAREVKEELGIDINLDSLKELGQEANFTVFVVSKWVGDPKANEESIKGIKWFRKNNLPYDKMHEGTGNWLPEMTS